MGLIVRSSDIHAAGCYTTTPISRGSLVVEYTGPRITKQEGDRIYENSPVTYLFGLDDGSTVIDGHGVAMFINHSCDPNCETEQIEDGVWIRATRYIAAGEELTYDYLLYDGDDEAPCYCGTKKCRGTMYAPVRNSRKKKRASAARRNGNEAKGNGGNGKSSGSAARKA